ncbi:MAG: AraC family transcriptional regulator [Sediminibacterium sp.]
MKTLIQKIQISPNQSFACRNYRTPNFETNWHIHEEFELILITQGDGTVMIGDYVGKYTVGDVFFIAGNLPHWFRKNDAKTIGSATVLHCHPKFFLQNLAVFPELKIVENFIRKKDAVQIDKKLKTEITHSIAAMQELKGLQGLLVLINTLQKLSCSNQYIVLTQNFIPSNDQINPAIESIIDYSFKHFLQPITLQEVAKSVNMSIPSFCRFFKNNIKKTYFNFLQELRIGHACNLLNTTNKPILEICYESGYNSWAHFSKQFKQLKSLTPSQYRKQFDGNH